MSLTISFFLYRDVSTIAAFPRPSVYCISNTTSRAMPVTGLTRSFRRLEEVLTAESRTPLIFSFTVCHPANNLDIVPTDLPNVSDTLLLLDSYHCAPFSSSFRYLTSRILKWFASFPSLKIYNLLSTWFFIQVSNRVSKKSLFVTFLLTLIYMLWNYSQRFWNNSQTT